MVFQRPPGCDYLAFRSQAVEVLYFCAMQAIQTIQETVAAALGQLYQTEIRPDELTLNRTKPEFEGDYTVVLFSLTRQIKKSPEALGQELGAHLLETHPNLFHSYQVIKGFLNLSLADSFWIGNLNRNHKDICYGKKAMNGQKVMVEYSSPNTNKPLHLGHLRNIFLGWSISEILKANGYEVYKSCIVNDRGIHICKSMIAWQLFAQGATPQSTHTKGDHFVGEYYVRFNEEYKRQMAELMAGGMSEKDAENEAPIMKRTREMLQQWEAGDPEVLALWKSMNSWVYTGFDETYRRLGSDFDKTYYESDTYLLGKDLVQQGLDRGVFHRREDGSVWIDLTADGLDEKLVLRKDGTSVYITQDIGLADQKYREFGIDRSIYVIGDEQNYHMKVLQLIAQKLGRPYAHHIYHLSYGMVELPTGKMKSREGTVVDADDMVDEMIATARQHTETLGKVKDFNPAELNELYDTLGLGAMKFYLLRVDPKKKMIFNPEESIEFHGFTGPFVQYTYARIRSILRRETETSDASPDDPLLPLEKNLLVELEQFPSVLDEAGRTLTPSTLATYLFHLAQSFNSFYTEHSVTQAETPAKKRLRWRMCAMTSLVLHSGMGMLGIRLPERM